MAKNDSPDGRQAACCGDAADAFARFQRFCHHQPGQSGSGEAETELFWHV